MGSSDDSAADVRFVFLVVDERGNPASINLVDGQLDLAVDGQSYAGEFTLTILDARGSSPTPATGTWRATRIVTGSGAMTMPAGMEGAATPAATPDA